MNVVVDAWNTDPNRQAVVKAQISTLLQSLAKRHDLDLSRLLGITVTDRYDEALAAFDRGAIDDGRILARSMGTTVGVAANVNCELGGLAYCQIFLRHSDVERLLTGSEPDPLYFLTHELSHAHDLACKVKTVEHVVLNLPGDLLNPPVFWSTADIVWNEYAACRKSGAEHPGMVVSMYEMLAGAVSSLPDCARQIAIQHSKGAQVSALLGIASEQVADILKFSSYVLGHRAALGLHSMPLPEQLLKMLDENRLLAGYFEQDSILANMWGLHGTWADESIYEPLLSFVRRSYATLGLYIFQQEGVAKLHVMPRILERAAGPC